MATFWASFLFTALLHFGAVSARGLSATGALLEGRLLGPHRHLSLAADLQLHPAGSAVRCLRMAESPPVFKYAMPVNGESFKTLEDRSFLNCTQNGVFQEILLAINLLSDLQESLCKTAASLLLNYTGSKQLTDVKCWADAEPPAAEVVLQGHLEGEPVTARLRLTMDKEASYLETSRVLPATDLISARVDEVREEAASRGRRSPTQPNSVPSGEGEEDLQQCVLAGLRATDAGGKVDEIILILGTTGAGKSTLVQFVTGRDHLVAKEISPGEFLIEDGNKRIGSKVMSKTKLPEVFIDPGTRKRLYDFPGFSDSRGACADIVTSSVLRKVAKSARAVKVVLVISHHSMQKGTDRLGFLSLLRHATAFVRDPSKFKDSVAIVVTKVPVTLRKVGREKKIVTDDVIMQSVASFLQEVKATLPALERTSGTSYPAAFFSAASAIIDGLLQKDGDNYTRIGLFRRPDEEGALSNMPLLQEGKQQLRNMIYGDVAFTRPDEDDFGAALSDTARLEMVKLVDHVTHKMARHVNTIADALLLHFKARCQRAADPQAVRAVLEGAKVQMAGLLGSVSDVKTPRAFLRRLLDAVQDMHREAPAAGFISSLNDTVMLEFLQDAAAQDEIHYRADLWVHPLQRVKRTLSGWSEWYSFLRDLQDALSDFKVQSGDLGRLRSALPKPSVTPQYTQQLDGALAGLDLDKKLARNDTFIEAGQEDVGALLLADLRGVLDAALQPGPLHKQCEPHGDSGGMAIFVRGRYVRLADVEQHVMQGCQKPIVAIHVQAEHTLFLDTDFAPHTLTAVQAPIILTIIAPRWHVVGWFRTVSVDGNPGRAWPALEAGTGSPGADGKAGGAAGSLFAVWDKVENSGSLHLRAGGGDGGPGQHGASGRNGADGETGVGGKRDTGGGWGIYPLWGGKETVEAGVAGEDGQNGGNGGKGGLGGLPGQILLLELGEPMQVRGEHLHRERGQRGDEGRGGEGGTGGLHGDNYRETTDRFLFIKYNKSGKKEKVGRSARFGTRGIDGVNSESGDYIWSSLWVTQLETPSPPPVMDRMYDVLIRTRRQALEGLLHGDRSRAAEARRLLEQLDAAQLNKRQTVQCDVHCFVAELTDLETARAQATSKSLSTETTTESRLLPRYEALLERLNATGTVNDKSEEQVLYTVHAAALSSALALRSPARSELLVDVRGYLRAAQGAVRRLAETKRLAAVWRGQAEIMDSIAVKVADRLRVLQEHAQPAVDTATHHLQRLLRELSQDLPEAKELKSDIQFLEVRKLKLQEAITNAKYLGWLKTAWKAVMAFFTGGAEAILPAIASDVGGIGEPGPNEQQPESIAEIPVAAGKVTEVMNLVRMTRDLWKAVNETNEQGNEWDTLEKIGSAVPMALKSLGRLLGPSKKGGEEEDMEPLSNRNQSSLGVAPAAGGGASGSTPAFVHQETSLLWEERALQRRVQHLQAAQRTVGERVLPLLDKMTDDLKTLSTGGKWSGPRAWQAQAVLRELRLAVSSLADHMVERRELQVCAELLNESLGALIAVMGELEECWDRRSLATSMARMSSVSGTTDLSRLDPKVADRMAKLHEIVRSNEVLASYKTAMHGFKQWVFPFALEYLHKVQQPWTTNNLEAVINRAQNGIESVLEKLEVYESVIKAHDRYISVKDFKDEEPFYVWNRDQHGEELDHLIEGHEVMLWADVLLSPVQYDAVKFDAIRLRLMATNASRQEELDDAFQNMTVSMTHLGDSYYKCGANVYVVSLASQCIQFSVATGEDRIPLQKNKVYEKLKAGGMMLSPFAMWKLQLSGPSRQSALAPFKGEVELVLEGHAQYVSGFDCSDKLDNYYSFEPARMELDTLVI